MNRSIDSYAEPAKQTPYDEFNMAEDIESACDFLEVHGANATPPPLHDSHSHSVAKC